MRLRLFQRYLSSVIGVWALSPQYIVVGELCNHKFLKIQKKG